MTKRRVVVTGLGIVSSLGNEVSGVWEKLVQGKSGVKRISDFDPSDYPVKIAGEVLRASIDAEKDLSVKERKKTDVFVQYGVIAAIKAINDSKLELDKVNLDKVGVVAGSGVGGMRAITTNYERLLEKGPNKVFPYFIPSGIMNILPGQISIRFGFKGPNLSIVTACSTGTHNIGVAKNLIESGESDIMIAGGAEKGNEPLILSGFHACRTLAKNDRPPEEASRPWDRDRDGFVLSDGAGMLVLEEYEHAKARGANIYAELMGFGMNADAYHITSPDPEGNGGHICMNKALENAKLNFDSINHINGHATSTKAGDVVEIKAIQKTFKHHAKNIAINSTKSMTGHLLGAAGAVEAIFTILALKNNVVPPTINLDNLDSEIDSDLNLVPLTAQEKNIKYAISNSFGFGGTNGCLVFGKI